MKDEGKQLTVEEKKRLFEMLCALDGSSEEPRDERTRWERFRDGWRQALDSIGYYDDDFWPGLALAILAYLPFGIPLSVLVALLVT